MGAFGLVLLMAGQPGTVLAATAGRFKRLDLDVVYHSPTRVRVRTRLQFVPDAPRNTPVSFICLQLPSVDVENPQFDLGGRLSVESKDAVRRLDYFPAETFSTSSVQFTYWVRSNHALRKLPIWIPLLPPDSGGYTARARIVPPAGSVLSGSTFPELEREPSGELLLNGDGAPSFLFLPFAEAMQGGFHLTAEMLSDILTLLMLIAVGLYGVLRKR